jgi:hypothetical protein
VLRGVQSRPSIGQHGGLVASGQVAEGFVGGSDIATIDSLPKFVMGHELLGAWPADFVENPTWET